MFDFIKNALAELEHVVWPTESESKKYMIYTVGVIVVMAALLAVLGYALRGSLVSVRGQFDHVPLTTTTGSGDELATQEDLEKLQAEFAKKNLLSGAVIDVSTASGKASTGITIENLSGSGSK
jgi:preprotein translocase SecE subunit